MNSHMSELSYLFIILFLYIYIYKLRENIEEFGTHREWRGTRPRESFSMGPISLISIRLCYAI